MVFECKGRVPARVQELLRLAGGVCIPYGVSRPCRIPHVRRGDVLRAPPGRSHAVLLLASVGLSSAGAGRDDGHLGRRAQKRHCRAAAHSAYDGDAGACRQVPRRMGVSRNRPRAYVPCGGDGGLSRFSRLGCDLLRISWLVSLRGRGGCDRSFRLDAFALQRGRVRDIACACIPADNRRLQPCDLCGGELGRADCDSGWNRRLLASHPLRVDAARSCRPCRHRLLHRPCRIHGRSREGRDRRASRLDRQCACAGDPRGDCCRGGRCFGESAAQGRLHGREALHAF